MVQTTSDSKQTFRVSSPLRVMTPVLVTCVITIAIIYTATDAADRTSITLLITVVLAFSVALVKRYAPQAFDSPVT